MITKLPDEDEKEPARPYRVLAFVRGETLSKVRDLEEDEAPVWPDLLWRELLMALTVISLLFGISLLFDAPLEGIADAAHTPNPAKAPWYFAGLQELLVYFDPWIAGVSIPGIILVALMAIPYLDPNRKSVKLVKPLGELAAGDYRLCRLLTPKLKTFYKDHYKDIKRANQ